MSPTPGRRRIAPSGDQFEITLGGQQAVVVEIGGGLRTYSADGHAVLDGYGPDQRCPSGRGQLLVPWPNRIQDGQYEFEGTRHQLPLTEPELGNAIHGLARWTAWDVAEREVERVRMEHVIHPQPGYPFTLALNVEYALSEDGLTVRTTATNVGSEACPYGYGAHPYLTLETETIDSLVLRAPGAWRALSRRARSARGLRAGRGHRVRLPPRPADRRHETRQCVHGSGADADGRAQVSLEDPATGRERHAVGRRALPVPMLFTGDPLPDVNRRALAVEPMTCPPNAFRTGDSVIRLGPGESAAGAWGIAAH